MAFSMSSALSCLALSVSTTQAAIVTSHVSDLVPFQERCDASSGGVGCAGQAPLDGDETAQPPSFLELNGKGFKQPSCDWTVYYDDWVPTFDKVEYKHPWAGGAHCLEACCRDPQCTSLQLLSTELFQCYKYNKPPAIQGREGRLLGDASWLLKKPRAWSVFVKGHPAEVAARLEKAAAAAGGSPGGPSLLVPGDFATAGTSSGDLFSWLPRLGVMVVLAAIGVRIMGETTVKAAAKIRFGAAEPTERLKLLESGS
eukprot:TRINITY_DN19059_c0_g1_i1.p1 TRINITY_DN19059_c0_g1~~TRINITY_DN19059_c0_g1_i1.p1  ORF type:complete len:256 (-),score=64.60 TRINITY_DN19059_c0_g1_i1:78-845(-)